MDRDRIVQLFFFGFLALIAYELYLLLSPFLEAIAWAILLAYLAHPAVLMLDRWIRRRSLSALIVTIVVLMGVVVPAIWMSGRLVAEAQNLYAAASEMVSDGGLGTINEWVVRSPVVGAISEALRRRGIILENEIPRVAIDAARFTSNYLVSNVATVARNVFTFTINFTIVLFTLFYLLRDGEGYYDALREITPLHEEDKAVVFTSLRQTLSAVMRGLILTALLQGLTIGAALAVFGVPYWIFLALLTAACGLLPIVGTALVWVPAALYLLYASGWGPAIGLVVWCSVAVAIIDNFIRPLAMKQGSGLPTMVLFFGIMGGLEVWGLLGLFAGPAIIAVFAALLDVYRRTYGHDQKKAA